MNQELWIHTTQGRLFAKRWDPANVSRTDAPPIVLFHESLGCVEVWRNFPERLSLATGHSVIAYDRLGFGKSDPHPGMLAMDFITNEATASFTAVRDQLEVKQFIAYGHSVGGGMAVVCAAAFPEQCRALVTESAQAFIEDRTIEGVRNARQSFSQEGQLERLKKYHGDKAAWVLSAWVDTWLSEGLLHWSLDDVLTHVRCPVLAIHGENDEFGSILHPERIASLTSGPAVTEILPDCGHVPHREKEQVVINAVTIFLDSLNL